MFDKIIILIIILIFISTYFAIKYNLKESFKINELPIIIYINLKKDIERNKSMIQLFKNIRYPSNKIIRFEGIFNSNGKEGCRQSHIAANKIGIENVGNSPYYIICEDDIKLVGDLYKIINKAYKLNNVDMFLLECGDKLECKAKLEYTNNKNFMRILGGGNNAGCYMIKPEYAKKNIKVWEENPNLHIDQSWQVLWKKHNVYLSRPVVFVQRGLKSNVEKNTIRNEIKPFDFDFWEKKNKNSLLCNSNK